MSVAPATLVETPARRLDASALLAAPERAVPWVVDRVAARGYATVIAAHGGEGKSLFALGCAIATAIGGSVAGIKCQYGKALILDGENGERLIGRRYRLAQGPAEGIALYEAEGFDLAQHGDWLEALVREENADLVVLDSFRSLAPRMAENDGDSVLPIALTLRRVARNTHCAVLCLHHRPKAAAGYRGSSVLRDQVDALFVLGRNDDDPLRATRRFLHCDPARDGKMRFDAEPPERWLAIDASGGMLSLTEAEPFAATAEPTMRERLGEQIITTLRGSPSTMTRSAIAAAVGRRNDDRTVGRALTELAESGHVERRQDRTFTLVLAPANTTANLPIGTLADPLKGADNANLPIAPLNALTADCETDL